MASQSRATNAGHTLAKVLGIKLSESRNPLDDPVTRGESVYSLTTAEPYVEEEPTAAEWVQSIIPSWREFGHYIYSLFPFLRWIGRYNLQWFVGDLVAGTTVAAVVVPQSMAYAKLAELPVEFGLYSSFMGVLIYWFFATSKDITIGPVAVMSTLVGDIVLKVRENYPQYEGHDVASALAIIAGAIVLSIGLARCGWIVDFIPLTAISAFMTGSAINIAVGQVPTMMGITGFSTRAPTYEVVINILKHLGRTKLDAAMGLTALTMLYLIRFACSYGAKKFPSRSKRFFFLATLRTAFVILLYVMISWLVNRHHKQHPKFAILGPVPRGFKNAKVPKVDKDIVSTFASQIPVAVIVLLIEHIAISKSFGRVNNYTINPSQELVAIGVTNLLGPFLGAYPATGSFSRTAIKSKAGVRTPLAGVITAIVVLLAIYALPAVFFYIPNASLAAVIIHAVGDLITPPNTVYQFWRVSPLEVIIFFAGIFVTIFSSIENGIYTTICASAAVLLFRIVKARGRFLGHVKVHSVIGDHVGRQDGKDSALGSSEKLLLGGADASGRSIFLPIKHDDGSNPEIDVGQPYPGIFIYRFSEGFNYPNANHYLDYLVDTIFKETRRTNSDSYPRLGDRPWNDPGPRRGQSEPDRSHLPTLKAVILDFSSVNNVDITSVQNLIDIRNQLDRWAAPDVVQWHLACINNRWTKRALISAGFGYPTPPLPDASYTFRWKPIFSVSDIGVPSESAPTVVDEHRLHHDSKDVENGLSGAVETESDSINFEKSIQDCEAYRTDDTPKIAVVQGLNVPFFYVDLTSALQSAIANVEDRVE
ncbi:sulfate transporter family-domain-containing protein [Lipomyces tetrasporus]|uniref:Sulfate transporter family-domain-containing protein n=1 Tax=Lipomyces tetrasporus TaxID=54092 RepID=A0AAD7QXP4_9ASCO|nr:sulfate transporter family-domain-containing protein [Lipomyces tetrasporus]KAJ8103369.1 sulfate transporter family-domain-containing protein [Lipomyces tetrasporus]